MDKNLINGLDNEYKTKFNGLRDYLRNAILNDNLNIKSVHDLQVAIDQ
jgi:hypothetical protein